MDPQLQRAYDALQQADAAGNKEDAQQIADYIRELQAQQQNKVMLEAGDESMMRNPVAAGAVGAIAGPVAGKVLETAYGPKGVPTGAPTTVPGAGSPGQKWAAKTGYGAGTGATVENVVEEFKKREGPLGKGKVTSKITGGALGGPAAMEQIAAKEADAARFAQMRAANQMAAQKASSVPSRIAQATAGKMPLLLKSAAGAGAGMQGADAFNRRAEGDYLGAGIGAIGAAGSAASLIPHPITRIGGTAIGMGAGALNAYLDYLKSKTQPQQPAAQSQPQNMAAGGLAGYAKGKAVKKVAESVAAKMSPGMSFGNVAPAYEQTVTNPLRNAFPGIYKRPDVIAQEAAARVAPESPALKQLFGVTRDDLYEMGKGRVGNVSGVLPGAAANPKGSRAAIDVMNPRNEQRLLDVLGEAEKYPALVKGMDPWYIMDPVYKRMEELMGPEKARAAYQRFNTLTGMASPGSDVLTEMNRGTAANYLATQGRFGDFVDYAGKPIGARGADFPEDLRAVLGHPYHKTAQAIPMQQYLDTGVVQMSSPKVPAYIQASGVPQTGFQTDLPVGDAHWSRAVGLADTRGAATRKGQSVIPGASVSNPEMSTLAPWWRDKIAGEIGIESVPAQARAWGAFSPQTGVESPIGAPKIELLSIKIMEAAKRLGVSPEEARDLVLKGEAYAGKKEGGSTTPAWQRSEGKSPSGGLNALGRASYKRETGGELKAPQPEGGSRKKSFCARMGGMKKKLTSSKTANDPDSRINKALRKWKC
jgi:hypothetical protein